MSKLEKLFVNNAAHSQAVSRRAEARLRQIPFEVGQHYLDVGCGNGAAPLHIARTFPLWVTGVDVDPEQIRLAEARSQRITNVHFLTSDATQLPFEDGEFDIVATNKATHHIPNWLDAMAEMVRVLKVGGYLIYSDLVYPQPIARFAQGLAGSAGGFPTRAALDAFISENHLNVVKLAHASIQYEGIFRKEG